MSSTTPQNTKSNRPSRTPIETVSTDSLRKALSRSVERERLLSLYLKDGNLTRLTRKRITALLTAQSAVVDGRKKLLQRRLTN